MSFLPKHWKDEHVIACLVRHLMIVDGEVIQSELDWMTKVSEDYSIDGIDVPGVWDGVDDDILKIFPVGSKKSGDYHQLVIESINFVDQRFSHENKQKLLHYLTNMAAQDDVVNYPEFLSLKSCIDCWFPGQLDNLLNDLKNSGIKLITSETSPPSKNTDQSTSDSNKSEVSESWNIIHDIGVFYMYFANLAEHPDGDLKDEELDFIGDIYPKWSFTIDGVKYGFGHDNPSDLQETWDHIFSKMYDSGDPMPRVNESHKNLVDYLNNESFSATNLDTLLNTLYDLCMADGTITEGQKHQLIYYCEFFKSGSEFANVILGRLDEEKLFEQVDAMFDSTEFDAEGRPIIQQDKIVDTMEQDVKETDIKSQEETIDYLNERILKDFPDSTTKESKSGLTSYYLEKKKWLQVAPFSKGRVELLILRDHKHNYYKPVVEVLDISNIRKYDPEVKSYQKPWGYMFYKVVFHPEQFNESLLNNLLGLIKNSYTTADDDKILKVTEDDHNRLKPIFDGSYKYENVILINGKENMKHKTTIAYSIDVHKGIADIINKITNLKHYIIEKNDDWGFELQMDKIIKSGVNSSIFFDDFIQFIKENANVSHGDDGNDFLNFTNLGKYVIKAGGPEDSFGSLDDGNVEFNNSMVIISDDIPIDEYSGLTILIQVNVPGLYANELNPNNEGVGIQAEAVDINGYHFEFII